MSKRELFVIIIGGGPVGLAAAHALTQANIDFVILERNPDTVSDAGSNFVLLPTGLQALDQLGLMHAMNRNSDVLCPETYRTDHNAQSIGSVHWFQGYKDSFGIAPRIISRHDFTRVLFETLPRESQLKIQTNKKVIDISVINDGVTAICADGTSVSGDFVLGADGAHSLVRERIRELALEAGSSKVNEEHPFLTTHRALWFRFPAKDEFQIGTSCETHGSPISTQFFVGRQTAVVGVYERLEKPTRERARFTQADQDALISRRDEVLLMKNSNLTLREAYDSRIQSGLVNLEEGVLKHWSWGGRVVLVGDAAHKYTPSTGAGCNDGIIDVCVLINELNNLLKKLRTTEIGADCITESELAAVFEAYQSSRHKVVVQQCKDAGEMTTLASWPGLIEKGSEDGLANAWASIHTYGNTADDRAN
ncbi:hypothetical protein FSARC_13134 [Fusarium sarcochroum]|uniref:FAD-binding domain-containing protein n=1 Tax=Fusarium sarcochroum TaxID=1208366 RepID=A0A8H4WUT1_9HYPO|nr:hypothetical protein FSARC_13134 [Fusarium sarcochroum]